ncbi:hypothetical protein [Cellulosilyticum lentocellum]|uniref:Transcription activator effector binding protein n=1 Tax=Cellulosilyticum lentocellum (strain ATCC 49066 / DSM 5427 / NCIMB 11756 / RHM5) TaxID=642492 RepID=F2JGE7_CELLD|nr:hypothetical protein [Cellulosilyticum lentocellum]ADZ81842.1 hypothetical protein Clole_0082 [Cellulosilyticum lentocellum DSM 5427]
MEIKENQELIMENVLSFRGKVTQQQMQDEMMKIGEVIQRIGVQKNGPLTTATFSVEEGSLGQVMDVEILVPLNKRVELPASYTFKPMIKVVHALRARHIGNPAMLPNTINALNDYIVKNNVQVITATYNVIVKDAIREDDVNDMIVDIYLGCNSNNPI